MKRILSCIGILMILDLCLMALLSEETLNEYGGKLNLITLPTAILITVAINHFKQNREDEDEKEDKEVEAANTFEEPSDSSTEYSDDILEEIVKKSDQLKTIIINEDYTIIPADSDDDNTMISKGLFTEIKDTISSILNLFHYVCHQKDFLTLLKKASHTDGKAEAYIFNLKSMFIKDVLKCYKEMVHSTKISATTCYGLCLYIITKLISAEDEDYDYETFKMEMGYDDTRNIYINNVRKQNNIYAGVDNNAAIIAGHDDFQTIISFAIYKDEITEYLRMLLFRLNQLIVKSEGKVSNKEIEWLEKILRDQELLEELYDDDNGKPLPMQAKKEWIAKAEDTLESYRQKKEMSNPATTSSPLYELSELIGLKGVKKEIVSLSNYIQMKQKRDDMGLKSPNISYHCVFAGNPGTGKTTVARILARIYKDLGILASGHLVETDRSGLVAEYVGQTAIKTNKIIDEALDGVLFIDEAYSIVQGAKEDYGKEAIATLLKRMEDDRDRLVVILAGYINEIEEFINSNPGLRSRFNRYIHFEDYTAEELFEIFCLQIKKNEFSMKDETSEHLKTYLNYIVQNKPKGFGNARFVRNLFEKTIENQANRLANENTITKEMLKEITTEDLPQTNQVNYGDSCPIKE